jgi:dolichol kinase
MKVYNNKKEIVRQLTHLFTGIVCLININFNLIPLIVVIFLFIIAIITFITINIVPIPTILQKYIKIYERENSLIGQGVITLLTSYFILHTISVTQIDLKKICLASMAVLTYGDSASTVFGLQLKRLPLFYNSKKNFLGLIIGIFFASCASAIFINPIYAIIGSTIAMFFESMDMMVYNQKLDDNLLVPLIAFFSFYILLLIW